MELMIGKVVKSHGIKGEVAVEITTDDPELRFRVGEPLKARQGRKDSVLTIESLRPHQHRLLIKFEEIADRTQADSLRGTHFYAEPLDAEDDEEAFYDHELEGLEVHHNGLHIGEVIGVSHGPAGELLEVRLRSGKEALIPFVHAIVPDINLESGFLVITPPEGLLDL
ncbi:ribosome maturation factor RimM [Corynebacterium sp. ES2794-CONJ1]|nr:MULTISPECIES: ribosome maturation factor RimM [unclassified Corynebacterium]MCS4489077.1 ribosome maturation factor RimM [Corynebacterium sp. ES2775-CONJ]MCS4490890.1 ribosome maturation factor RimM [Corynebacterium sp. ES2715-CONJ3]MCS4531227.1 ribosome maturation factor RimM [Corynebacterium sp. ES2730-CONJ]MCU9518596.1 ribosome maturation factor RimM [Corynebacterium sp. ES2794-CONJ1]